MADAAVETPQTAGAEKDVKATEASTKNESKTTENGASDDVKEPKATNGEKKADEEDDFERYGADKKDRRDRDDRRSDRRDRDDYKRRDYDDRGRGRGRGGRGGGRGRGRGGGRGGYDNNRYNRSNNVKTRFERKDESSDATEIRRQIEFYFSDSNLPVDNYLLQETGGPENRPFPLKTIHNFKRMRHYQPFSAIVDAVKGSSFLKVNDKDEVYRNVPLAKHFTLDVAKNAELLTSESMARSIYAKGFGEEEENTAFKIEEFFEPYGVRGVRLRREKDGTFKGSVFVEFEDEAAAKQFLEMEEKPKFNDNELEVKSKKEYVDMKSQDIRDGKVKPNSPTRHNSWHHRNERDDRRNDRRDHRDKGSYNKRKRDYDDDDDVDRDDWRERRDRFQKKGRRDTRSRSRSPYRKDKGEDKEDDSKAEKQIDEKSEEKKADEPKSDEQKPEESKVEEAKAETEATA